MRAGLPSLLLALGPALGCRAAPAWEPLGGFELVDVERGEAWRELAPAELRERLAAARGALDAVRDHSAVLETRERIEDELHPRRVLLVKVRHEPFSVAIETTVPPSEKGQRVWYDERRSGGALLAETPGLLGRLVGRVALDPEGEIAMENRRHPITDTGLLRLLAQVEERFVPELDRRPPPRVRATETTVAGRALLLADALVPREPPEAPALHRLGFDAATGFLVHYGLAELLADGPALVEEYLYRDVRTNLGLADADFRPGE
jgi:hypothetical protein